MTNTVFRDAIMLALLGFVAMVVLMLAHLNPPTKDEEAKNAGNIIIEATWPDEQPMDVDLWVQGPNDAAVGYSYKNGEVFDLLRDDLGRTNDLTPRNYEFAFSRGIPPGDYTVNLHLYNTNSIPLPITVLVEVTLHKDGSKPIRLAIRQITLTRVWQEVTVIRFRLDSNGSVVPGSVHELFKQLRPGK